MTVDDIKDDPQGFVDARAGERIIVEGYFNVEKLTSDCVRGLDSRPWVMLFLDLSMSRFQSSVDRWIVVSAEVERPRDLKLGGGDLYIPVRADDQAVILANAKLLAVDEARRCG